MLDSIFIKACNTYFKNSLETHTRTSEKEIKDGIEIFKKNIYKRENPNIYLSADGRSLKMLEKAVSSDIDPYGGELETADMVIFATASAKTKVVVEDLNRLINYNKNRPQEYRIPAIFLTGNIEQDASRLAINDMNIAVIHNPSQSKLTEIKEEKRKDTINIQGTLFEQDVYRNITAMMYGAKTDDSYSLSTYRDIIDLFSYNILKMLRNIKEEPIENLIDCCIHAYENKKSIELHTDEISLSLDTRLRQEPKFRDILEKGDKYVKIGYTAGGSDIKTEEQTKYIHKIISDCVEEMKEESGNENIIRIPWEAYEYLTENIPILLDKNNWAKILTWHNMIVFNDAITATIFNKTKPDQELYKKHHKKDFI